VEKVKGHEYLLKAMYTGPGTEMIGEDTPLKIFPQVAYLG
jgi:hypothetical protein